MSVRVRFYAIGMNVFVCVCTCTNRTESHSTHMQVRGKSTRVDKIFCECFRSVLTDRGNTARQLVRVVRVRVFTNHERA